MNKNFELLSNKTTQIKQTQSLDLKSLSNQFSEFITDINKKIQILSHNYKLKHKQFLLDEDNYNKKNKEFTLDLKPDLQSGKMSIINLEINDSLNIVDLHNNRFYFKLQHSESSNKNTKESHELEKKDEIEISSITIEPGNYTVNNLLKLLNTKLEKFNLYLETKSGYLTIKLSKKSDITSFSIYNFDNSILPFFGFKLRKYEGAVIYTSENKPKLQKPNIYNIYLIDNDNTSSKIAKYSFTSKTVFMDEYTYNSLQKLRFKIKLENGYLLSLSNISNLELSITYTETDSFIDESTDSTYSFVN